MILNEGMCNKTEEWILKQSRANVLFYVKWRFIYGMLNHMCLLHISFIGCVQCFFIFWTRSDFAHHSSINIANKQLKLGSCLNSFSVFASIFIENTHIK